MKVVIDLTVQDAPGSIVYDITDEDTLDGHLVSSNIPNEGIAERWQEILAMPGGFFPKVGGAEHPDRPAGNYFSLCGALRKLFLEFVNAGFDYIPVDVDIGPTGDVTE